MSIKLMTLVPPELQQLFEPPVVAAPHEDMLVRSIKDAFSEASIPRDSPSRYAACESKRDPNNSLSYVLPASFWLSRSRLSIGSLTGVSMPRKFLRC